MAQILSGTLTGWLSVSENFMPPTEWIPVLMAIGVAILCITLVPVGFWFYFLI
uniref:Uncharacterized protein n=1 Tax=Cyanothece sp. (strain PCC 7425 / ATCC 29141) TaxID=395961 RepID=B8HWR1_CYAP4